MHNKNHSLVHQSKKRWEGKIMIQTGEPTLKYTKKKKSKVNYVTPINALNGFTVITN
jgi:hypothetical protein